MLFESGADEMAAPLLTMVNFAEVCRGGTLPASVGKEVNSLLTSREAASESRMAKPDDGTAITSIQPVRPAKLLSWYSMRFLWLWCHLALEIEQNAQCIESGSAGLQIKAGINDL